MDREIREAIEAHCQIAGLEPLDETSLGIEIERLHGLLCMVDELGRFALFHQFGLGIIDASELKRRCLGNDPWGKLSRL